MPNTADPALRHLIVAQRHRLGDLAETLDDTHWASPSLCAGWQVRDVMAHCTQTSHRDQPGHPGRMSECGLGVRMLVGTGTARPNGH
jgi:Mycothiol maleylpyruvate isomerase N-terminal domain